MADWTKLEVTWRTTASPPPDDTIYLPPGKPLFGRIVVRTAAGAEVLAKAIARPGHGGEGAVATGTLYQELGGITTARPFHTARPLLLIASASSRCWSSSSRWLR